MTPAPQEYIITEDELKDYEDYFFHQPDHLLRIAQKNKSDNIRAREHTSASSDVPEPIGMNSTDIMLLAHDEWKRREERKHTHPEEHWVPGFINGFLTDKKWAREYVKKIRQQTKEQMRTKEREQ